MQLVKYWLFITIFFFSINTTNAQIGPGGVNANNVFWVKADSGLTLTGTSVSNWADNSIGANDASQLTTTNQPTYTSLLQNYNPSIYFDGNNDNLTLNNLINTTSTNLTIYAIGTNEGGGDLWHAMVTGQTDSQWTSGGYGLCSYYGQTNFGLWINQWNNHASSTWIGSATMPSAIIEGKYDGNTISIYQNATLNGTTSSNTTVGNGGSTTIGGGNGTANSHKGHITEVAIYDTALAQVDRNKINSYFALKYGITADRIGIGNNYYNSLGNSVFSGNQYWYGIIGIGRDDKSTLYQKQSHDNSDNSRIYLANLENTNALNIGSFSVDNQFLVMGHNNDFASVTNTANAEKPASVYARIAREWKLTNTNFTNTFSLSIKLNICVDIPQINAADLRLLIDDDGNFSNASVYNSGGGLAISISGNIVTITGLDISHFPTNSSKYFTIASINGTTLDDNFQALPVNNIHTCDINQNGIASFTTNLSSIENQVVGAQTGLTVSYYDHLGNSLNFTDPFTNTVANLQTITVRVTNSFGCYDETTFDLVIDPLPNVSNLTDVQRCVTYTLPSITDGNYYTGINGSGTLLHTGDAITSSQTIYIFSNDGTCTNETDFIVTINQLPLVDTFLDIEECGSFTLPILSNGNYFTEANATGTALFSGDTINTSQIIYIYADNGNCTNESSFGILIHPILPFELTLANLFISDENDVNIQMPNLGISYEYQLDNLAFQPNNNYYDLDAGIHTLTVKDSNSCVVKSIFFNIVIFDIPKSFTPNNDGYNDYWNITDSNNNVVKIAIYDRYGKLLKTLIPNTNGWDGTINNKKATSNDYWYIITLNNGKQLRGHFSLKR